MTEPVHRPPLTYVLERRQFAKVRALSYDAAVKIAETLEDGWSIGQVEVIDVIEET